MNGFKFETPSRQSAKGILVMLGVSIYKVAKATFILIIAFFVKYIKNQDAIDLTNPILWSSIFGVLIILIAIAVLRYRNFIFYVNADYFILKKGVIKKEELSVSKTKIQNVYIKQNVLQQIINTVSLSIETAGDDKTEIEITALSREKANALKQLLLSSNNIEDHESQKEEEEPIYFKASMQRILLEGLSENHIKSFVLIFGFIVGLYDDIKRFLEELEIGSQFTEWFQYNSESFVGLLMFNLSILIVLLVLSFLLSLVRVLIQNFNLTVTKKDNGLEVSKGLFNKINLGLIASRIQTTTVSTNRLKRALGLYQLSFTQAMVNKKQRLKFKIIGLSKLQINELLERFYPDVLKISKRHKPELYFVYRAISLSLIPVVIINLALFFLPAYFFLLNIPILVFIGFQIYYAYKRKYFSIDDTYVIVGGGGLIERTTSYLEISKIQAVTLKQTIFQKRRDLGSVQLFSASKSLVLPHIKMENALSIKNYLLFKVESENKDWM